MPEALDAISRVGNLVGGAFAVKWARELRLIAARLAERSKWGPTGTVWAGEARRLCLAATVAEHGYERQQGLLGAKALAARLPELEAAAVDAGDELEVAAIRLELEAAVGAEAEQARMRSRGNPLAVGKAFAGKVYDAEGPWGAAKRQRFIELIEAGGGGTADGKPFNGDPLAASLPAFARAEAVVNGAVEPSPTEAPALERFVNAPRPGR